MRKNQFLFGQEVHNYLSELIKEAYELLQPEMSIEELVLLAEGDGKFDGSIVEFECQEVFKKYLSLHELDRSYETVQRP